MIEIDEGTWGYDTPHLTPDEILAELDQEVARAIAAYDFIAVDRDDARANPGFARASAAIPVSPELFDQFFNSRTSYRAHYFRSEAAGERFNRRAVDIITRHIQRNPHLLTADVDAALCDASLRGPHTKVWFPKEVSAVEYEAELLALSEVIRADRWHAHWQPLPPPRKGLLAPQPDVPGILLNGTFVNLVDGSVWDQKPYRSRELFDNGWT